MIQHRWRSVKHLGTEGSMDNNSTHSSSSQRQIHPASDGQQGGSSLCSESRGGSHSRSLANEVAPILTWAEKNLANLQASYIPPLEKQLADHL